MSKAFIAVLIGLLSALGAFAQTSPKPTKAELKEQQKAAKQAAKDFARKAREAATEAQRRADHVSFPLDTITVGCVVVDSIAFHKDVQRGWGGLMGGGSNAVLGVTAYIGGTIHNNCNRTIVVNLAATFYDRSGVRIGGGQAEQLVNSVQSDFAVRVAAT